jgi:transposase-like protein
MPRKYPPEFRQRVLDLVAAGRPVVEIAHDLAISPQTIYSWRNQHLIDIGERAGLSSTESAELLAARREITKLRTELTVVQRANELLKESADPKGVSRR